MRNQDGTGEDEGRERRGRTTGERDAIGGASHLRSERCEPGTSVKPEHGLAILIGASDGVVMARPGGKRETPQRVKCLIFV